MYKPGALRRALRGAAGLSYAAGDRFARAAGVPRVAGGSEGWSDFPKRVLQIIAEIGGVATDGVTATGNGSVASPIAAVSGGIAPTLIGFSFASANAPITLSHTLSAGAILEGDLLIAIVSASNFTSVPAGWFPVSFAGAIFTSGASPVFGQVNSSNGTTQKLYAFARVATSAEASYTYTFGAALGAGVLLCVRGGRQIRGFACVDGLLSTAGSPAFAVAPPLVAELGNSLAIAAIAGFDGSTAPAGWTTVKVVPAAGGTNFELNVSSQSVALPGLTPGGTYSSVTPGSNNEHYGSIGFCINGN